MTFSAWSSACFGITVNVLCRRAGLRWLGLGRMGMGSAADEGWTLIIATGSGVLRTSYHRTEYEAKQAECIARYGETLEQFAEREAAYLSTIKVASPDSDEPGSSSIVVQSTMSPPYRESDGEWVERVHGNWRLHNRHSVKSTSLFRSRPLPPSPETT